MLIAFAGCDGSGKSTQVKKTAAWLQAQGFAVEIIDKWDILDKNKFPECRFIDTELDDLRVCIAEMQGVGRAMFLFWSIALTLSKEDLQARDKIYLLDGYWMKHAASEILYGCAEDWVLKTAEQLPKPEMIFYFDTTPEVALARKEELTPYECGRKQPFTEQDFIDHQSKLHALLRAWAHKYNWIQISSLTSVDEVFSQVTEKLSERLRKEQR